jgi:outer membrane protein
MRAITLLIAAFALSVCATAKPRVAVLNVQKAILATDDGKAAATELQRKFASEQATLSRQQQELQGLEAQLGDGASRSAEEIEALESRIGKLRELQRRLEDEVREKVQEEQRRVLGALSAKMLLIVEEYAKQKHFEAVFDESDPRMPLYWRAANTDITNEVIKRYGQAARKR